LTAPVTHSRIDDVRTIELPRHQRADGEVVVAGAATGVPFAIARMFTLNGPLGAERGKHAHRRCSQVMLCVHGAIEIVCDDGSKRRALALDCNNFAILVPPMIWNTVVFRKPESVLVVLCDRPYEEHDYIRSYPEFLTLQKAIDR
jgi:dTDP-4-dehydrorhamnose 3,5-epimerase-like enzyme